MNNKKTIYFVILFFSLLMNFLLAFLFFIKFNEHEVLKRRIEKISNEYRFSLHRIDSLRRVLEAYEQKRERIDSSIKYLRKVKVDVTYAENVFKDNDSAMWNYIYDFIEHGFVSADSLFTSP